MRRTHLLIVGAGPFGLSAAARAKANGIDFVILGRPLAFWKENMPRGMYLRSAYDWHLDPQKVWTFERYLADENLPPALPVALDRFIDYGAWFARRAGIDAEERRAIRVEKPNSTFVTEFDDGERISSSAVLCAPGFLPFRNRPELPGLSEVNAYHSADLCDLSRFVGRRVVIIGGRQSAMETAVLLAERGAPAVTVVHRHPTPSFAPSDWSWVAGDLDAAENQPNWFASLPMEHRRAIEQRFWAEGRLKLEPWLGDRLGKSSVDVIPSGTLAAIEPRPAGHRAHFRGERDQTVDFDDLILATGFKVDVAKIDYLRPLLPAIASSDGYPALTASFESTSLPGLYFTGLIAARHFGPYMGFTASCPFAARVAVDSITRSGIKPA